MLFHFPTFYAEIQCADSFSAIAERIQLAARGDSCFAASYVSEEQIVLCGTNGDLLCRNSWDPVILLVPMPNGLHITIKLKRGSKVAGAICRIGTVLLLILAIFSWVRMKIPGFVAWIFLGLLALEFTLDILGLWIMSNKMMRVLCEITASEQRKRCILTLGFEDLRNSRRACRE